MNENIQNKIQAAIQHIEPVVGYSVAGGVGSAPVWVGNLTGWLQLIAVTVAIAVGLSTWKLNQLKIKKLDKRGRIY